MPNTVYGPYTATTWVDSVTQGGHLNMNNLETQASVALHGINPALSGPFVYSGITCAKDGTIANQLDIASGVAFATLSDGTTGQITVVADNTHTTATPSTTYYLFLKNDGTWQWSTTSTGPANSLPICQATTDASGNILAVSDQRHKAGSPGVPYVVARALNVHVTSTAIQTLLDYTVPVTGLYRVSGGFEMGNTSNALINFGVGWVGGGAGLPNLNGYFNDGTSFFNGVSAITHGWAYAIQPQTFYAQAATGSTITVQYTDRSGAPNDWVTAIIERLT